MTEGIVRAFGHNRAEDLRRQLMRCPEEATLVIVDGVYSMSGDVCHLDEIVEVCREFGATLLVDDAHGLGVLGDAAGTCHQFGLTSQVDLITVTFSKAFASIGGAVASDPETIHYLRHHARSEVFSASMTPASTATALAALRIAKAEPWRAEQAMANASFVRSGLKALGLDVGDGATPIVPIRTASVTETLTAWRRLLDLGVYTNAVLPPAASSRLRTSFSAAHTRHQLEQVVEAFGSAVSEGLLIHNDQDVA
jgi:8-amino-7-oxononanoate synthase